jgi:hypothetical protein
MTQDNVNTFLIDGGKGVRNRERRAALEEATRALQHFARIIQPIKATSKEPECVTGGLGLLYNWIHDERERASAAPGSYDDDDPE